jgi:hypothetical protein
MHFWVIDKRKMVEELVEQEGTSPGNQCQQKKLEP